MNSRDQKASERRGDDRRHDLNPHFAGDERRKGDRRARAGDMPTA